MALVRVTNVDVLNNPAHFLDPMQFEITFEAQMDLPEGTVAINLARLAPSDRLPSCSVDRHRMEDHICWLG
jgi:hypothetical protein